MDLSDSKWILYLIQNLIFLSFVQLGRVQVKDLVHVSNL